MLSTKCPLHTSDTFTAIKLQQQFEADLIVLKQQFHMPTWVEFAAQRGRLRRPDRPALLITFDDGLSECYRLVRPLLLKHRVPCLFFITKAFVDNRAMFFRHKASLCIESLGSLVMSEQKRALNALAVEVCAFHTSTFLSFRTGSCS